MRSYRYGRGTPLIRDVMFCQTYWSFWGLLHHMYTLVFKEEKDPHRSAHVIICKHNASVYILTTWVAEGSQWVYTRQNRHLHDLQILCCTHVFCGFLWEQCASFWRKGHISQSSDGTRHLLGWAGEGGMFFTTAAIWNEGSDSINYYAAMRLDWEEGTPFLSFLILLSN